MIIHNFETKMKPSSLMGSNHDRNCELFMYGVPPYRITVCKSQ